MTQPTFQHSSRTKPGAGPRLFALMWLIPFAFAPMAPAVGALSANGSQVVLAQAGQVSSSEAAEAVEQRFGGRVLKVETRRNEIGALVYRVKILQDDGRIRTVNVDGQSGRIID